MSNRWQLQQAKARLSEVVDLAISTGPQIITRRGKDSVVVLSAEQFSRQTRNDVPLGDFLYNSPLRGTNLHLERSKDAPRATPDLGQ